MIFWAPQKYYCFMTNSPIPAATKRTSAIQHTTPVLSPSMTLSQGHSTDEAITSGESSSKS